MTDISAILKQRQQDKNTLCFINGVCQSEPDSIEVSSGDITIPARTTVTIIMIYDAYEQDHVLTVRSEAALNVILVYLKAVKHSIKIDQACASQVNLFQFAVDAETLKNTITVNLNAERAVCTINGVQFANARQSISTALSLYHYAPYTESDVNYRSIADQQAEVSISARVHVAPGAVKTVSEMNVHNLLLSNAATIDALPELEIYADDVKCSHGSTVGDLSEDSLFYLISRGIGQQQARSMLMQAFLQAIIDQLDQALRPYAMERIAHKLTLLESLV